MELENRWWGWRCVEVWTGESPEPIGLLGGEGEETAGHSSLKVRKGR